MTPGWPCNKPDLTIKGTTLYSVAMTPGKHGPHKNPWSFARLQYTRISANTTSGKRNKRTTIKRFRSQSSVWTKKQPRTGNQLPHVQAFKDERYVKDLKQHTKSPGSKAYFAVSNKKGTNSMKRLLSSGDRLNLIKTAMCEKSLTPLLQYESYWCLFLQSVSQSCKLTFANASFWVERAAVHTCTQPTSSISFSTCKHIHRARSCEKSRELAPWF